MKSVITFNKDQRDKFNRIVSDLSGPTMTAFVLLTLESVIDTGNFNFDFDGDEVSDVDVCLAALEYHRMQTLEVGK